MKQIYVIIALFACLTTSSAENPTDGSVSANMENITLETDNYWNGSDESGGFASGLCYFSNSYTKSDYGDYWSGWAVSNTSDITTEGWSNQYSAITGQGFDPASSEGSNYAVGYPFGESVISFPDEQKHQVSGFYVTNSTYTALSMENGDAYSKKFGGDDRNDPDWFKLTIKGFTGDVETSSVEVFLADFRFEDNAQDYILKTWEWVDLSTLGEVTTLKFSLSSSDNGDYGMNTPGYFCVDNFQVMPASPTGIISNMENITLETENYWNGSDKSGGFESGLCYFVNSYNADWASWNGWAVSNTSDVTTPGWNNQYSAITGQGFDPASSEGSNYAVGYPFGESVISFPDEQKHQVSGFYVTNSTYTTLSMENGDTFSKKFGGDDGNDSDWFKLTIKGFAGDVETSSVEVFLADFRFEDNSKDYILKTWEWVDLSTLGEVTTLKFSLSSSDNGDYGMNTPGYFCADNIQVMPATTTGINTHLTSDVSVFPSPFTDHINLRGENLKGSLYRVYAINGQVVMSGKLQSNQPQITTSMLPQGIYLISIETQGSILTKKVVKY